MFHRGAVRHFVQITVSVKAFKSLGSKEPARMIGEANGAFQDDAYHIRTASQNPLQDAIAFLERLDAENSEVKSVPEIRSPFEGAGEGSSKLSPIIRPSDVE